MKLLLIFKCLCTLFLLSGCESYDGRAPLEKIVSEHRLDSSEVTFIYMFSGAEDYRAVMLKNLKLCADQKLEYLAVSTFDLETEKVFLSLLNNDVEKCSIIFYGTEEAVRKAKIYFLNGIFVSGSLNANSNIKQIYADAAKKIQN